MKINITSIPEADREAIDQIWNLTATSIEVIRKQYDYSAPSYVAIYNCMLHIIAEQVIRAAHALDKPLNQIANETCADLKRIINHIHKSQKESQEK